MKNIDIPDIFNITDNNSYSNMDKIQDDVESDIAIDSEDNSNTSTTLNPVVDIYKDNYNTDNPKDEPTIIAPEGDPVNETIKAYRKFDTNAWNKKCGFKLPHFPYMEKKLEGLDEGLYLFASEANCGKTALMTNILFDACTYEDNHLLGLYFSLDDSKQLVIPRVVAMTQNIPISVGSKPYMYKEQIDSIADDSNATKKLYQSYLDKREKGLNMLISLSDKFQVRDNSDDITTAEEIHSYIEKMITYVKAMMGDEYSVIVAIDSLDDIRFKNEKFQNDTDRHKLIAKTVKDWATEFHVPIFGSRHLNKIRMDRKPVLDDLKDTSEYVYEATVVWLLYNEVGKKNQSATVYYTSAAQQNLPENQREKQPVIEMIWAKNKASSYKGKSYCYFMPEFSKTMEVSESEKTRFDSLSY